MFKVNSGRKCSSFIKLETNLKKTETIYIFETLLNNVYTYAYY